MDYTTSRCKLCPKSFAIPSNLEVPQIPEPLDRRTMGVIQSLMKHVQKAHTTEFLAIDTASKELFGLSVLRIFEHENESLEKRMGETRANIHRIVGITADDGAMEHRIAGLGLNPADAEKVFSFCKDLRDVLTERTMSAIPV